MTNVWHDISIGSKAPKEVSMIVEIPKNSRLKYELDKNTGLLKLDRFLFSSVHYPGNYGFIPRTLWDDNDPLDIFVITHEPVLPMTLCKVKPIGVLRMIDSKEEDDKIIAVHCGDPRYSEWDQLSDVPKHMIKEIEHFFNTYKEMEKKKVKVKKLFGKKEAHEAIIKGINLYNKNFEV